jgi:hypothetical protein
MTTTISRNAIERAIKYVREHARPLDVALLDYRLGAGSQTAVLGELAAFQNDDGGFGHGLEPDLPTPASTAIATSVGFRHMCAVDAAPEAAIVRRGLAWLEANFDRESGVWPIINRAVDLAPHAPWWNFSDNLKESWSGFRYNPTAELLGALYRYREHVSADLLNTAERQFLSALATAQPANAFDLKCAASLIEAPATPATVRERLQTVLVRSVREHDAGDPHLPFLEIAPHPESVLAKAFPERAGPALTAMIAEQQPDGSWQPFWNWSDVDQAAWNKAELEWRGVLTRQAIEALLSYGAA